MKANGKGKIICTRCGSWWPEEIEVCEVLKFSNKELLLLRLSLLSQIWIEERALVVSRTQVKRLYKLFFKIQNQDKK